VEAYDAGGRIEAARLYGNINKYAYYFTDLLVGMPNPQRVSVIVDTGSSLCGFPCEECKHCGHHIDPPFRMNDSSSAAWVPCSAQCEGTCQYQRCSYTQSYTEGSSITGHWFQDLVQLGDAEQQNPPVKATLGCHIDERKLFYTQRVNGIMGMAPHENSGRPTILQDLWVDKAHVNTGIFALCLAEWGGRLTVGGYDPTYHSNSSQIQWLQLLHSGYYSITLENIELSGIPLATSTGAFGTTLLDSGTTFTYLPAALYHVLSLEIVAGCTTAPGCGARREGNDCWRMEDANGPVRFPPLTLVFENGIRVLWPPRAYMFERGEPTLWCHAFSNNGEGSGTVLGASFMLHKDVIFDLEQSKLGIVEAACPEHLQPPGESPGEFVSSQEKGKPLAFTMLLVAGIIASLPVAVGVFICLVCDGGTCGASEGAWPMAVSVLMILGIASSLLVATSIFVCLLSDRCGETTASRPMLIVVGIIFCMLVAVGVHVWHLPGQGYEKTEDVDEGSSCSEHSPPHSPSRLEPDPESRRWPGC